MQALQKGEEVRQPARNQNCSEFRQLEARFFIKSLGRQEIRGVVHLPRSSSSGGQTSLR